MNPLKDTIKEMKEEMAKSTKSQTEINSEMKINMEHIIRQSQAAQYSAEELTRAFKHKSKVQGDWGEIVLSELLTGQGLTEGVHYHVQTILRDEDGTTIRPDDGSNLRPDVVLHLDEKRDVIIDSKVSLKDYIDYVNADNEQEQNHQKLYDLASTMLDRVGLFLQHYEEIGKWLEKVNSSYADGTKQLADNGQSIVVAAKNMIHLGVKNKKAKNKLPQKYTNSDPLLEVPEETEE